MGTVSALDGTVAWAPVVVLHRAQVWAPSHVIGRTKVIDHHGLMGQLRGLRVHGARAPRIRRGCGCVGPRWGIAWWGGGMGGKVLGDGGQGLDVHGMGLGHDGVSCHRVVAREGHLHQSLGDCYDALAVHDGHIARRTHRHHSVLKKGKQEKNVTNNLKQT